MERLCCKKYARQYKGVRIFLAAIAFCALATGCQTGESDTRWFAVGDSYMSGDGNPVAAGEGVTVWSLSDKDAEECRRSDESGVSKAFNGDVFSVACSGAKMSDLLEIDGQLSSVIKRADKQSRNGLIIGAGGNDARWAEVLGECVSTDCVGSKKMREIAESIKSVLPFITKDINAALVKSAVFEEIWIATYPNFGYRAADTPCSESRDVLYGRVTEIEWREMWERTGSVLNELIRETAREHGWGVIELEKAFYGHSVCDSEPYVNGVGSFGSLDSEVGFKGFAHPNDKGYEVIASVIRKTLSK